MAKDDEACPTTALPNLAAEDVASCSIQADASDSQTHHASEDPSKKTVDRVIQSDKALERTTSRVGARGSR